MYGQKSRIVSKTYFFAWRTIVLVDKNRLNLYALLAYLIQSTYSVKTSADHALHYSKAEF